MGTSQYNRDCHGPYPKPRAREGVPTRHTPRVSNHTRRGPWPHRLAFTGWDFFLKQHLGDVGRFAGALCSSKLFFLLQK